MEGQRPIDKIGKFFFITGLLLFFGFCAYATAEPIPDYEKETETMSTYITDDPVKDAERYYGEQDDALEKLPKCSYCGHHIQDDRYFEINGEAFCEECMWENFSKKIEDYME